MTEGVIREWELRNSSGSPELVGIDATADEMLVLVEAANARFAPRAPFYATAEGGRRIESESELDAGMVDRVLDELGAAYIGGGDE